MRVQAVYANDSGGAGSDSTYRCEACFEPAVLVGVELHLDRPRESRLERLQGPQGMSVRLLLSSGKERIVDKGEAARLRGSFFIVSRWDPVTRQDETILTLLGQDVAAAEVLHDGVATEFVLGGGRRDKWSVSLRKPGG
jgi:hypothetical protein